MSKVVLVAEDDSFLGDTICLGLREHGIEAHLARDGEEAVTYLEASRPDLLLLDLVMPRKDGYAVLQHIKKMGGAPFPIVILSNLSTDLSPEKCRALGVQDYVVKSDVDEDELWPKLSKYL